MLYTTDLTLWNMYLRDELISCLEEQYDIDVCAHHIDEIKQTVVLDVKKYVGLNVATKQALDKMYDYFVEYDIPPTKALLICQSAYSLHKWLGFYDYDLARLIDDNQKGMAVEKER